MSGGREQISIDDFGNLLGRRTTAAAAGCAHSAAQREGGVSAAQLQEELQDQIHWYRREMERKEKIIHQLGNTDSDAYSAGACEGRKLELQEELVQQYRLNAEDARSELSATIAKMHNIEADMRELQGKLSLQGSEYSSLKAENDTLRENNARQAGLISSMRSSLAVLEEKASKVDLEYQSCSRRMEELEATICRKDEEVRGLQEQITIAYSGAGTYKSQIEQVSSNMRELYISILTIMGERTSTWDASIPDDIQALSQRVQALVDEKMELKEENSSLKTEIEQVSGARDQFETEVKAGRETIMRLVSETERYISEKSESLVSIGQVTKEKEELERTIAGLEGQITHLQNEAELNAEKYGSLETRYNEVTAELEAVKSSTDEKQASVEAANAAYERLRENIAAMLSHSFHLVDKQDDSIVMRVRELIEAYLNKKRQMESLEVEMSSLLRQKLDSESWKERVVYKERRVERVPEEQRPPSQLQKERVQYLRLLERLSALLNMDKIVAAEVGVDANADAVLARVEQLVRKESDLLVEKGSTIYGGMQRKNKELREALEGKELHLDMLRKKIAQLEEKSAGKLALNAEKEDTEVKLKKMTKMNEKLRGQLGDARLHITELKAELSDTNAIKLKQVEKDEEIRVLVERLDHSEKVRNKQAKQLAGLKQELEFHSHELRETTSAKEERVGHMANELANTKRALEEVARRERQLVEFRSLVGRLLGLDTSVLTVPDYEIVSKLERLVQHHHVETTTLTCNTAAAAAAEGGDGGAGMDRFWEGYESAKTRHQAATRRKKPQPAW